MPESELAATSIVRVRYSEERDRAGRESEMAGTRRDANQLRHCVVLSQLQFAPVQLNARRIPTRGRQSIALCRHGKVKRLGRRWVCVDRPQRYPSRLSAQAVGVEVQV